MQDHVHILFELARTSSIAAVVEEVKTTSSKWLKQQEGPMELRNFSWQSGYGAFSVSESMVQNVRDYIANQREHHRQRTFQEEYRIFLDKHAITYDERYVWD